MKSKIFGAVVSVALAVMLLCSAFLTAILYKHFNNSVYGELKNQAFFISHAIAENDSYLESIASSDNRITVINSDGTVALTAEKIRMKWTITHSVRKLPKPLNRVRA